MIRNWQPADGQRAGKHSAFAKNVEKWIAHGYTKPELCFVCVDGLQVRGGIAYADGDFETANILDFSIDFDEPDFGAELLSGSQAKISARSICYHLYNDSERYGDYKACFVRAGFTAVQEKLSYRYTGGPLESGAAEVSFRSFTDAGERAFVEAVALVTQKTLDRMDARSVAKHGQAAAAEILVKELREIDFQPNLWLLAYAGGKLMGLVVPTSFGDSLGGINYIGVVPAERGKGYADALLRKGTQLLVNQGITTVIADIDVLNFPMKGALERAGYIFAQEETVLEKTP